jgi:hypothetical protein
MVIDLATAFFSIRTYGHSGCQAARARLQIRIVARSFVMNAAGHAPKRSHGAVDRGQCAKGRL